MVSQDGPGSGRTAVVVGGGIGGLGAARALQRAGWSVQVLEQTDRLEPLGAGISLWPNAMRALESLDVALPVVSTEPDAGGIRTDRGRWLSRTQPATFPIRYGAPLIAVHREQLQQALLASVQPHTLVTGARVSHVDQQPDSITVQHAQGAHRAELVVLADGLASPSRQLVTGNRSRPRYAGYTAWRGVTGPGRPSRPSGRGDQLVAPGGATESWGRGQRFGLVPLADGRTYWFATANTAQGQRATGGEHAEVLRRFTGWHEPIRQVLAATDATAVLRHDIYDLRPDPTTYVHGRLVLLGDAAHAMTPNLGQGACQALEDAAALGALLSPGADVGAALAQYDALRRPRAQRIARQSRYLGRVGQLGGRTTTTVRNLLIAATPVTVTDRGLDATLAWQPPTSPPSTHGPS